MIAIDKTLISEDLLEKKFVCDLNACKGACCVAGDSGAPLEKDELPILDSILEKVKPYMVKKGIKAAGLEIKDGDSAIVPVMLYDAKLAQTFAAKLLDEGIYVIGFFFPVVPKDKARIRVQLSAAHTQEHLDKAIAAFAKVGKELGVVK